MKPIQSPFYFQCPLITDGTKLTLGRKLAYNTHKWMESHEGAFKSILRYVKGLQRSGFKGRLHDRVAIYCIDNGIQTDSGEFKFSNDIWTGIERYLVLVDPSLRDNPVKAKQSAIDLHGLFPVSYLSLEQE